MRSSQSVMSESTRLSPNTDAAGDNGIGVVEDERFRIGAHRGEPVGIAAPPRVDRRQLQRLAEQVPCRVGEERLQPQPIGHSATERVGDADVAFAHRLQQPGDATQSGGSQFERIRAGVGESAEDDIDLLEAAEGSQPNTTAAGDEVSAAGQVIAEVGGEVRSLDEARPLRLRSEQDRARPGDIDGSDGRQRRTQIGEPSRQRADAEADGTAPGRGATARCGSSARNHTRSVHRCDHAAAANARRCRERDRRRTTPAAAEAWPHRPRRVGTHENPSPPRSGSHRRAAIGVRP